MNPKLIINLGIGVVSLLILIFVFIGIRKLFIDLGLLDSKADKEDEKNNPPFNVDPNSGNPNVSNQQADYKRIAQRLFNAMEGPNADGYLNTSIFFGESERTSAFVEYSNVQNDSDFIKVSNYFNNTFIKNGSNTLRQWINGEWLGAQVDAQTARSTINARMDRLNIN